jgi:hypothetical protein
MPKTIQWVKVPLGASGSSKIKARFVASPGTPLQVSGGGTFSPSQVYFLGRISPELNAVLVSSIIEFPP